jgi:hypothetical protein
MSIRAMCVVCAVLLCLVGAESWWFGRDVPPPLAPPMLSKTPGELHPSSAAGRSADLDKTIAIILGRPLLSPSRRPAAVAQDASAVQRKASLPKLSGIIHAPDLRRAIFQSQGSGKPIVTAVSEGQAINDWTVRSIGPESVTLVRDGEAVLVRPTFGTITIEPPPTPPPVSRWVAAAKSGVLRARWANPQLQP